MSGETNYDAMWRTFIGNFGGATNPAHQDYKKHFSSFLHDLLSDGDESIYDDAVMSKELRELILDPISQSHNKDGNKHLYSVAFSYVAGLRRFFVTRKGYMGLGPRSMQPADEVFVFSGGDVPFILRQSGSGEHRLIGEVFVHGIMNGEVLEDTDLEFSKVSVR